MDRLFGEFLWYSFEWFWWFSNANAVYVNDGYDDNCNDTDNQMILSFGFGKAKIYAQIGHLWFFKRKCLLIGADDQALRISLIYLKIGTTT